MKLFRQILFWSHLAAGLIAGLFIGIMCFTGTVLAFEHEIAEWAERDARQVGVPANLPSEALAKEGAPVRLPLADLQRKLREAQPDFRPASVVLRNDPASALAFSAGRDDGFFVNPYTGEARQPASTKVHDFMHLMTDWHRFLGREGEQRPLGKLINGICNIAFCVLALTGLYLWMPRTWSWAGVKAVALFKWDLAGKARDFNWHNAIGLWSAPILIVLTLTAIPISFRWGGNLIYRMTGEEPPAQQGPGQAAPAAAAPAFDIKRPSPDLSAVGPAKADARPLGQDLILANIQRDFPRWEQITLRTGGAQRGGQRPASANGGGVPPPSAVGPAKAEPREASANATAPAQPVAPSIENRVPSEATSSSKIENPAARPAPQPLTVIIREAGSWPRTATTTLTLNPFTGETLKREGYADLTAARQIRAWTRFLHTGQALGWSGQLVAGLACLGGCFLVYTGFALSWRRFFGRRPKTAT
jgi:uncharacterized iron-regulated membrane protein